MPLNSTMTSSDPAADAPARGEMNSSDSPAMRGTKASRQRFKPQLSCMLCRTRKLKCDRNNPCQNCIRRDQVSSCVYVPPPIKTTRTISIQKPTKTPRRNVQNQISHLEDLVVSLMNKRGAPGNTIRPERIRNDSRNDDEERAAHMSADDQVADLTLNPKDRQLIESEENATESFGVIQIEDRGSTYVESFHWEAILENIACLRDSLENSKDEQYQAKMPRKPRGPQILTGLVKQATRTEILSALPSKTIVDHLIEVYFSIADNGATVLHQPTFKKEYGSFWANPSTTSIAWIGMLFSILFQAVQFHIMASMSISNLNSSTAIRDPVEMINIFSEKTVQCLILGNYTEPGPYTIETLLFYYIGEHFRSADTIFGLWMIFGIIVRAGMRLGLHRDPSHSSKISVIRAEMNRRLWSFLVHLDLWNSCQIGLPRMIREEMYDTHEPSNLLDEDFDENTMVLPAPRIDDLTPMAYYNMKHRIVKVFGEIMDQTTLIKTIPYQQARYNFDRLGGYSDSEVQLCSNIPQISMLPAQEVLCLVKGHFDIHIPTFNEELRQRLYRDTPSSDIHARAAEIRNATLQLSLEVVFPHSTRLSTRSNAGMRIRRPLPSDSIARANQLPECSYEIWTEASSTSREASKIAKAVKETLEKARAVTAAPLQVSSISHVQPESGSRTMPLSCTTPDIHPRMAIELPEPVDLSWTSTPSFDMSTSSDTNSSTNFMGDILGIDETLFPVDMNWDLWDTEFQGHAGIVSNNFQDSGSINPADMQWEQQ